MRRRSVPKTDFLTTNCYACARLTGVPAVTPVPIRGSFVKNVWPKLSDTVGRKLPSGGARVMLAFGEFTPAHRWYELAPIRRSAFSKPLWPKLSDTVGRKLPSGGARVMLAFGEFTPAHRWYELAPIRRSAFSKPIWSRRQPAL